ncbi:tetratricopeptide repeat protein [Pirellulaceae bacterium]|nr:tetratricopeptide repeat protein [Pirellulaceae bacterium]
MSVDIKAIEEYLDQTDGPWHIRRGELIVGPFARDQVQKFVETGNVGAEDDLQSADGIWKSLADIEASEPDQVKESTSLESSSGSSNTPVAGNRISIDKRLLIISGAALGAVILILAVVIGIQSFDTSPESVVESNDPESTSVNVIADSDLSNINSSELPGVEDTNSRAENDNPEKTVFPVMSSDEFMRWRVEKRDPLIFSSPSLKKVTILMTLWDDEEAFLEFHRFDGKVVSDEDRIAGRLALGSTLQSTLESLGYYDELLSFNIKLYEQDPVRNSSDVANAYYLKKDYAEALKYINQSIVARSEKSYADTTAQQYNAYLLATELQQRAKIYNGLASPPDANVSFYAGKDIRKNALVDLKRALSVYPYELSLQLDKSLHLSLQLDYGGNLLRQANYEEAYKTANKVIELFPNEKYSGHSFRFDCYLWSSGKYEGASRLTAVEDATQLYQITYTDKDKRCVRYLFERGKIYVELDEYVLAREDADRISSLIGDNPYSPFILGDIAAAKGQIEQAVLEYSAAISYEDSFIFVNGHGRRAAMYRKLGLSEKASKDSALNFDGSAEYALRRNRGELRSFNEDPFAPSP